MGKNQRKVRKLQMRLFRCEECGTVAPATKRRNKRTAIGHIKTMWCYVCREVRDHVQIE